MPFPAQYKFYFTDKGFALIGSNIPAGDFLYDEIYEYIQFYILALGVLSSMFYLFFFKYDFALSENVFWKNFWIILFLLEIFAYLFALNLKEKIFKKVKRVEVNKRGIRLFFAYNSHDVIFVSKKYIGYFLIKEIKSPENYVVSFHTKSSAIYDPNDIYKYGLYIGLKKRLKIKGLRKELTGEIFTGISFENVKTGEFLKEKFDEIFF